MYFLVDFRCHAILDPWASNNRHTSSTTAPQGPLTIGCPGDYPGREKKPAAKLTANTAAKLGVVCFFSGKEIGHPKMAECEIWKACVSLSFFSSTMSWICLVGEFFTDSIIGFITMHNSPTI